MIIFYQIDDFFLIFSRFQRFYLLGGCSTSLFGICLSPRCKLSTQILVPVQSLIPVAQPTLSHAGIIPLDERIASGVLSQL